MTLSVTHSYVSSIGETTPSGGPGGTVGPTEWNANHTLTGTASPAQGGTGITSGLGVTYFSSATVIADSGTLSTNQLVVGGGPNGAPATIGSLGTTSQVLHGNASGNPSFGAVNLASEVAGTLSTGNLQTATTAVFGIVKPDNSTVTISSGVLSSVSGGPGGTTGNVQFASAGSTFSGDGSFTYGGAGTGVTMKLSSSTSTAGISALSIVTSSSSNMASNASALNITAAWNNSATVYDAPFLINLTPTANAANSAIFDLQNANTSFFSIAFSANGGSPTMYFGGTPSQFGLASSGLIAATDFSAFDGSFNRNIDVLGANSGQLRIGGSGVVQWWSGGSVGSGSADTGLGRSALNVLEINTGTQGTITGTYLHWGGQSRVTADATSTSTTLANVPGLSVTVAASRNYTFEAQLFFTDAAAGGIQAAIGGTAAGANCIYEGYLIDNGGTFQTRGATLASSLGTAVASSVTTGTNGIVQIYGTITTSSSGTLTVQWCQNTGNATSTTIKRGSYFIVHDMV